MSKANGHIFISYAREDRGRVAILAKLFEAEGWPVWWDRENMSAGRPLNEIIGSAIDEASCVLVCWSKASIKSRWVIDEATEGLEQEKLLPILFDAVKPPLGFRNIHHINLIEWDDKSSHAAYQRLKVELANKLPLTESDVPIQKPAKSKNSNPEAYPAKVQTLLKQFNNPSSEPNERLTIGDELAKLGDPRPGVGLDNRNLPDIAWVKIPGGKFLYGKKKESRNIEPFYIACFSITNEQYQAFINDAGYRDDWWWERLSERITEPEKPEWNLDNRPRETVSWYEAIAYCRWLSHQLGFMVQLPTEEQWERAARGTDGREYPWGDEYIPGYANVDEKSNKVGPHFLDQTSTVGIYPSGATPEGVYDLVGNVWEWCLNEYSNTGNTSLEGDTPRVLRGGSWYDDPGLARASVRDGYDPVYRGLDVGFRVVCSSPIPH